jgi:hypothetical protein
MTCVECGRDVREAYLCDRLPDKLFCGDCFDGTDCGRGLHEEGCSTKVMEDE